MFYAILAIYIYTNSRVLSLFQPLISMFGVLLLSDGSVMKLKGKIEELDGTSEGNQATMDRSKYMKLEMPMFLGEIPKSWVYRAEQFFEINTLP